MRLVRSKEPDDARARAIADEGDHSARRRRVAGARPQQSGTDDREEMAVHVEPREYVLGLRQFQDLVYRTRGEGEPSGPGDLDLVVYGLRKYCGLVL